MLLALVTLAAAAEPFVLPPGETAQVWSAALDAAGFQPSASGEIVLAWAGDAAVLRVRGADGRVREAHLARPLTQAQREDAVWLARSLREEGGGGSLLDVLDAGGAPVHATAPAEPTPPAHPPPVVSARRKVTRNEPVPEPPEPTPAPPTPPPAQAAPEPEPEPAPTPVAEPEPAPDLPPAAPRRVHVDLALGGGVLARTDVAPAPTASIGLGLTFDSARADLRVALAPEAALAWLDADRTITTTDLRVTAGWQPPLPIAPRIEGGFAFSWRRYAAPTVTTADAWAPQLALTVGVAARVSSHVSVDVGVTGARDLPVTTITVDGARHTQSPWSALALVEIRYGW